MECILGGKRYRVEYRVKSRMPAFLGHCTESLGENDPGLIRIRKGLDEKTELDTLIHEALHASDWSKSEEWIEETAKEVANLLWGMGWRKGEAVG